MVGGTNEALFPFLWYMQLAFYNWECVLKNVNESEYDDDDDDGGRCHKVITTPLKLFSRHC